MERLNHLNAIRAIDDHVAGGIIVPFNVVDKFKTWWNRDSDFALHLFKQRPFFWFHLAESRAHEHGWRRSGTVLDDSFEMRDEGLFAKVVIDDEQIWQRIVQGGNGFSTGTMPNLMKIRNDGYVERWPVVELSGAPTEHLGSLPNTTTIEIIRVHLPEIEKTNEEIMRSVWMSNDNGNTQTVVQPQATPTIDPTQFTAMQQQLNDVSTTLRALTELVQAPPRVIPVTEPVPEPEPAPALRVSVGYHWDNASLFTTLLRAMVFPREAVRDEQFMRCIVTKMSQAREEDERVRSAMATDHVLPDNRQFMRSFAIDDIAYQAWHKRVPHLRANEVMATSDSGWADLLDTAFESVAWHYFRMNTPIFSMLPSFMMSEPTVKLPLVTGGPTWNLVSEVTNQSSLTLSAASIPDSKVTMDDKTWSTKVIGALTFASEEVFEETNVDMAEVWAREYLESGAEAIDFTLINGDETDTDDNISHWTTGSGTTDIPSTETDGTTKVLAMDGLRHQALTTGGTDNKVDAGGALASDDIILTRRKLGTRGALGLQSDQIAFVCDVDTFYEVSLLSDYKSASDVENLSTLKNGILGTWRGTPVKAASEKTWELSNATGQIPAAADGTKGQGLGLWLPGIRVGVFRKMNTEVTKPPHLQARAISSTFRIDLQVIQPKSVAMLYNITLTS